MAFSNSYDTTPPGSAVSNREDLTSRLTVLEPEETPILSLARKDKAKNMYHEWTIDKLADPTDQAVEEGADVSSFDDKFEDRDRIGNRVQKWRRTFKVSEEQQQTSSVGPANLAAAEIKAMSELKRDVEYTIASDNDRATGSSGTASATRGLGDWLDSAGPADVSANYRTPSGSIDANGTSITETQFNDVIDSIFNVNGEVNRLTCVFATALRRAVTSFTRAEGSTTATPYNVNQDATSKKITLAVSFYESDHGIVSLTTGNPKCMPATDRGYFLNTSKYGFASFIPMHSKRLENQGGGERGYCSVSGTLVVDSPLAHGKVT